MTSGYDGDPGGALSITKHPTLYWACPDIWVGQPGGTTASPGANVVGVRFHYDESLVSRPFNVAAVEVYVFDPTLAPPPGAFEPGGSAVYALPGAAVAVEDFAAGGTVAEVDFAVPPPAGADPHHIVAPNSHRCLIARVFPNGTSTPTQFDVADGHEAQRNIFIVATTADEDGPKHAGVDADEVGTVEGVPLSPDHGWWTFVVNAWTPALDVDSMTVVVGLRDDIDPASVEELLGEGLTELGIKRVSNLDPERTGLVVGEAEPVHGGPAPAEVVVQMRPANRLPVGVVVNLGGLRGGTAYAVHAEQALLSEDGRTRTPVGGATFLFHRADLAGG